MSEPQPPLAAFLTDASIVAVANAVGWLGGVAVSLRDHTGRRIERTETAEPAWCIRPPDPLTPEVAAALRERRPAAVLGVELFALFPIHVNGVPAGAFVVETPGSLGAGAVHATVGRCLTHLCSVIDEFCTREIGLNQRNEELALLYRLLSALTASRDAESAAETALRLAVQHFDTDAGVIHLLDDARRSLVLAASLGLSDAAAADIERIPADDDAHADAGERAVMAAAARDGLAHGVGVELHFHGRRFGVLRLLTAAPSAIEADERGLLRTIAAQAADAIGRIKLAHADRHARRQFKMAAEVQRRMLPERLPDAPGLDIAARCESCLDIGGDFYDVFESGDALALAVADVAGKGVAAGLLMASVRAAMRAHAVPGEPVGEVVRCVNLDLCRDTQSNEFATLFLASLDPRTGRCAYCNAGHEPPLVVRRRDDAAAGRPRHQLEPLDVGGMAVGVDPEQPYESAEVALAPGDVLIAFTDGVVEAMDFDERTFGRERLRAGVASFLNEYPTAPARLIVDHIAWELRRFAGLAPQSDDTTILVIRRHG